MSSARPHEDMWKDKSGYGVRLSFEACLASLRPVTRASVRHSVLQAVEVWGLSRPNSRDATAKTSLSVADRGGSQLAEAGTQFFR